MSFTDKDIVVLDFDKTITTAHTSQLSVAQIPATVKPGLEAFLQSLLESGTKIYIASHQYYEKIMAGVGELCDSEGTPIFNDTNVISTDPQDKKMPEGVKKNIGRSIAANTKNCHLEWISQQNPTIHKENIFLIDDNPNNAIQARQLGMRAFDARKALERSLFNQGSITPESDSFPPARKPLQKKTFAPAAAKAAIEARKARIAAKKAKKAQAAKSLQP